MQRFVLFTKQLESALLPRLNFLLNIIFYSYFCTKKYLVYQNYSLIFILIKPIMFMKRIRLMLNGIKLRGENIIDTPPTLRIVNTSSILDYGEWKKTLRVSEKCPELRTLVSGNNITTHPNLKTI